MTTRLETADASDLCQSCGACCSYSRNWPRFTIEDDAALDLIPAALINERIKPGYVALKTELGARLDG